MFHKLRESSSHYKHTSDGQAPPLRRPHSPPTFTQSIGELITRIHKRLYHSSGIAGYVATTGETLNITNAYEDERFNREVDLMTGYKTSTLLCMPIYIKDRIIGVVELVNKKGGVFTRKDEQACTAISLHLSNHSNRHNNCQVGHI